MWILLRGECSSSCLFPENLLIYGSFKWLIQTMNFRSNMALQLIWSFSFILSQYVFWKLRPSIYFFDGTVSLARPPGGIRKFPSSRVEPAFSGPSGMFQCESRDVRGKFPFFSASPCSRFGMPGRAFILQSEIDGREFVKWRKRWDLGRVHYLLLLCGQ